MIRFSKKQVHAFGEIGLWVIRRRRRVRVTGRSMEPTLYSGDYVFVDVDAELKVDDIVVARHPRLPDQRIIKRLAGFGPTSTVDLRSDNPQHGTDSAVWGPVPVSNIEGVVTLHINRALQDDAPTSVARRLQR